MKGKIFSLFVMFLMCLTIFTGCSSMSYSFFQNEDGSLSEVFSVSLISSEMPEIDCDAFSQKIKDVADEWATEHNTQLTTQGVSCAGAKLESENGVYTISITIKYQNSKAYNDAWATDDGSSFTPYVEKGWFQDKYVIYQGKTEFAGSLTSSVGTKITDWLSTNYPTYNWQEKLSSITGTYTRVYPNSIAPLIDNNGALLRFTGHNYTYCLWSFNMENPDFEITMYKNVVLGHNRANWFITALIITAICGVILYFALQTRKRKIGQQAVDAFINTVNQFAKEQANEQTNQYNNNAEQKNDADNNGTDNVNVVETNSYKVVNDLSVLNEEEITQKQEDLEALVEAPKKIKAKPKNTKTSENKSNQKTDV